MNRILAFVLAVILSASCAKTVGSTIDDGSITTRVKTALIAEPSVGIQKIDVDTFKGVVTLSGRVPTKEMEQKAIELAKAIKGVVDVKSSLAIGQ